MAEQALRRTSPNCLYLGDVVKIDVDGYGFFIGRITRFLGSSVQIENGLGGSQLARISEVLPDERTHRRVSDWTDKLRHDTRIT